MDLTLKRTLFRSDGIFGRLEANEKEVTKTLEHSYQDPVLLRPAPKIPTGKYQCLRGKHRLHGMEQDFETFEITGVPGHSKLLFHWGNWNRDSDGCVLLGHSLAPSGSGTMVTASRATFESFMKLQQGVDSFTLTVSNPQE